LRKRERAFQLGFEMARLMQQAINAVRFGPGVLLRAAQPVTSHRNVPVYMFM